SALSPASTNENPSVELATRLISSSPVPAKPVSLMRTKVEPSSIALNVHSTVVTFSYPGHSMTIRVSASMVLAVTGIANRYISHSQCTCRPTSSLPVLLVHQNFVVTGGSMNALKPSATGRRMSMPVFEAGAGAPCFLVGAVFLPAVFRFLAGTAFLATTRRVRATAFFAAALRLVLPGDLLMLARILADRSDGLNRNNAVNSQLPTYLRSGSAAGALLTLSTTHRGAEAPTIQLTPTSGPQRTTIPDHKPRRRGNAEPHVLTGGHQRVAPGPLGRAAGASGTAVTSGVMPLFRL